MSESESLVIVRARTHGPGPGMRTMIEALATASTMEITGLLEFS